jgi:hypothetical protein
MRKKKLIGELNIRKKSTFKGQKYEKPSFRIAKSIVNNS